MASRAAVLAMPPSRPVASNHKHGDASSGPSALVVSDDDLVALAAKTASTIQWDKILHMSSQWQWLEGADEFSIYTKQDGPRFAVLAVGIVSCCAAELRNVMYATKNNEHIRCVDAMHGSDFRDGEVAHDVDIGSLRLPSALPSRTSASLGQLSVKTVTFNKTGWLSSLEDWCYLDAIYDDRSGESFEKLSTSLDFDDFFDGKPRNVGKRLQNMVTGYFVHNDHGLNKNDRESEQPGQLPGSQAGNQKKTKKCRVYFYAEMFTPKQSRFSFSSTRGGAGEKTTKSRLLQLARNCARLPRVVRSRRLGVQVLVNRSLFRPPSNLLCLCCSKTLLIARLCRLCGHIVCENCSDTYERERLIFGQPRMQIDMIRVCGHCMTRVDATDYSNVSTKSLRSARVTPNNKDDKPADAVLTDLLQDALMGAKSHRQKESVMSVIKHILDLDSALGSPSPSSSITPLFSSFSSDSDYIYAIQNHLEVKSLRASECEIANAEERQYQVNPNDNVELPMTFPMPDNEEKRVQMIKDSGIREVGANEELNIICSLAKKELDCLVSFVTIMDKTELYVAASSMEEARCQVFPRDTTICTYTIMGTKPMVIPHPEADIRFHRTAAVADMGARFYCGFPVFGEDNKTVIGTVCCVDSKSRDLTEAEYTSLSKLAETASKVVRVHTQRRKSVSKQAISAALGAMPPLARHS
ncbi:hypothetical protein Poli38472_004631 [Pythium oligandrum]|uniref:GAF domain-containing protein n=1 Tax=Pythium oligandrum TaxID=41045 RepID=A0A8K1CBZ4_PYTOL|nr:hypothetical protein Poli38472_004631 [Pythium oligandrum]|eukprot:TMW59562.1 hypothetical protein Poli38472_004631 [Pythium oligandrum]